MRMVPIFAVREDSRLGKAIYDSHGRVLLQKGVKLRHQYLKYLARLGHDSVYVEDEYSHHQIKEVIKPAVVTEVLELSQSVMKSLSLRSTDQKKLVDNVNRLTRIIQTVLDNILASPDVVANLLNISCYDDYTYKHSLNCMILAVLLGDTLKLSRDQLVNLAIGTLLHDMGKLFIPSEIVLKPTKLDTEELEMMRKHPRDGYDYLKKVSHLMPTARIIALEHHERWDGCGYPEGKKGEESFIHSRITAVCDVFEALTANRPYRAALSVRTARDYVAENAGSHFEEGIVAAFLKLVNPYPLDSLVRLSDGREGVIRAVNKEDFERPEVEIYYHGLNKVAPYTVSLQDAFELTITEQMVYFSAECEHKP